MNGLRFPLVAGFIAAVAVAAGWGLGQSRRQFADATSTVVAHVPSGALLFQAHCAKCHGPEGHGDGDVAGSLRPPARDFAARPWRFEPTTESIQRVIVGGSPGTPMPAFRSALSEGEVGALTEYVFELATRGPIVEHVPTIEEQLLTAAGFTMLGGSPPILSISDAEEGTTTLADLRSSVVLLHFWGTGCSHCLKEMPALNELAKQYAGRLKVLHICADEADPAEAQRVLDRVAPGTKAYTDTTGLGLARFELHLLPTVWLIDRQGHSIARASGAVAWTSNASQDLLNYLTAEHE